MNDFSHLPSVDTLLRADQATDLIKQYGRELTLAAIRDTLDDIRMHLKTPDEASEPLNDQRLLKIASVRLQSWLAPTLCPVINATGVILHTNLGRAPLSQSAQQALLAAASGYNTLEYDLLNGSRGSRTVHASNLLCRLTGAEAALVVNNNAAAMLLVLSAFARRKGVVISRTQLVEIGGGFRIPEVMAQSGARLIEVGTTNRVSLADYESALERDPIALLHAHHSNFKIIGFTSEPALKDLADLASRNHLLMIDDQGSGALLDTAHFGLGHEPTVQESLAAGCDLVCFSGDKLLGGPQAGIILGKNELVAKLKKHPLARAMRVDKLCLAALSATLIHYLKGDAENQIPVWRMISETEASLKLRTSAWQATLDFGTIIGGLSTVGGGSLPEETLPTSLLALDVRNPHNFMVKLRQVDPPVIARIENDQVMLDPRTVLPAQDTALLSALQKTLD
ncbi:MAG: L-seryl-tRNA(Sec) selenium transferase [Anaerolineaceae bacterium]|nr:L-seryl-tRNA(Sec) selenium transferase [Anaerolineaceae bacterium]MBN2676838.1 L-seryl-tRNA(Sec) selenium transferase [Anaerolineaceae bacterium]